MKKITISLLLGIFTLCVLLSILVINENKLQEKTSKYYQDLKVGETAILKHGSEMTLNSVTFTLGDENTKPTKGKFLILDLTIKNESSKEMDINTILDYQLKDSDGAPHNIVPEIVKELQLKGSIPRKEELRGKIVYDVPESQYYEFLYRESYSKKISSWKFETSEIE